MAQIIHLLQYPFGKWLLHEMIEWFLKEWIQTKNSTPDNLVEIYENTFECLAYKENTAALHTLHDWVLNISIFLSIEFYIIQDMANVFSSFTRLFWRKIRTIFYAIICSRRSEESHKRPPLFHVVLLRLSWSKKCVCMENVFFTFNFLQVPFLIGKRKCPLRVTILLSEFDWPLV